MAVKYFLVKYETRNNNDQEQTDPGSVDTVDIAAPNFIFAAQPAKYSTVSNPPSIDLSVAFPQGTNLSNLRVEIWAFPHQVPGPGLESDVTYRPATNKGPVDLDERPVAWLNGSYEEAILAWEGPATTFQQSTDNNDGSSNSSQSKITWQLPEYLIDPLEEITLNAADPNAGTVTGQWTSAAVPFYVETRYDKRWVSFWCRATSIDGRKKSSYWPPVDTPQPVSMAGYRSFVNASNVTHCGGYTYFAYGFYFDIIWPSEVVTLTADTDGTITNLADSIAEVKVLRNGRLLEFNPGSGGVGGGLWDMTVTLNDVVVPEPTLVGSSNAHVTPQGGPAYAVLNQIQGLEDSNGDPVLSGTITYTVVSDELAYVDTDVVQTSFTRKFRLIQFGADQWKIRGSNETHVFSVVPGGTPTNDFVNTYTVERSTPAGDQPYTWSSDVTVDFSSQGTFNNNDYWFRYSVDPGTAPEISGTNCTPLVNSSDGTITISSSGASPDILQDEDVTEATIFVPFEALHSDINLHTTLYNPGGAGTSVVSTLRDQGVPDPGFRTITLHKAIRGVRGGEFYILRASVVGLTEAEYNAWAQDPDLIAGANTTNALEKILTFIMGPEIWSSGTTYSSGERVHYQGSDYLSQQNNNLGNEPFVGSSFWTATSNNDKLSPDRFIRPNDVITISNDVSTAEEAVAAATRIYEGIGYSNPKTPGITDFSSLVVETFDGSVIVKGTLSADKIAANQGVFNQLRIGSNIVIGETPADWVEGQVYGLGSVVRGVNPDVNLYEYISTTGSVATQANKPTSSIQVGSDNGTWYNYGNLGQIGWLYTRNHSTFGDSSAGFYMDYAGNFEARTGSGGGLSVDAENDIVTLTGTTIIKGVGGNLVTFTTTGSAVLSDQGDDVSLTTGSGTVYSNSTSKSPTAIAVIGEGDRDFEFGLLDAATSEQDLANTATNHDYSWFYDSSASTVTARDGGVDISGTTLTAVPNDTLQVVHDGLYVRFLLGSRLIKTITLSNVDSTIYLWFGTFADTVASGNIAENIAFQRGASFSGNDVAPTVDLIAPQTIFYYNKEGNRVGSGNITLTALASGTLGNTVYYQFVVDGVDQGMQAGNTFSYTPPSTRPVDDSINITAEIRYVNNASADVVGTSTIALNFADESESPTQIQYTNENVVLVSDAEGNVTDFTDSGTVIEVIEGFTPLDAQSPGAALNPGEFKIASVTNTGSKVTLDATPTPFDTTITYDNITAMDSATDSHTVTYNLEIRTFNGTTQNRSVSQSFTKAKAGNEVAHWEYTNTAHAVPTNDLGGSADFSGSGGILQVYWGADVMTPSGFSTSYPTTAGQYNVDIFRTSGDTTVSTTTSIVGSTVEIDDFSSSSSTLTDVTTFDVDIYLKTPTTNSGSSEDILLSFQISLTPSKQGSGGLSGVLTNENHTVATGSAGTGYSLTGAGGTFKVYSGASDVTTNSTFSGNATQNGLTISINTSGVYTLTDGPPAGASWVSDEETFTLTATYGSESITKTYTISKAKAGPNGAPAKVTSVSPSATFIGYSANPTSTSTGNPNQITFTWEAQGYTNPVYAWQYKEGSATQYSNWINETTPSVTINSTYGVAAIEDIVEWDTGTAHTIEVRTSEGTQGVDASTDAFSVGKGADGADGDPGESGEGSAVAYVRSDTTPTVSGSTNPPGGASWSSTIPTGSEPLWIINGTRAAGATTWSWGTPQLYKGDAPGIFIVESASPINEVNNDKGVANAVSILNTNSWPFTERTYLVEGDQIFVRSTGGGTYDVRVLECIVTDFPTVGVNGNCTSSDVQLQETTFIDGSLMVNGTIASSALVIGSNTGNDRIVVEDNKIEVYAGGNIRVRLGDLTP